MGVVVANSVLRKSVVGRSDAGKTRQLLRAGIVLLGFRMQWSDIVDIGIAGLAVIVLTVVATYWLTMWMGRILGLERGLVSLIAAGFSICGAAAIAMMQDALKVKQRDVGYALALVTAYGTVMMAAVPLLSTLLRLPEHRAAIWAGASIHEVAQVVASAAAIGPGAVALATSVKLGRVMLLAPTYALVARNADDSSGRPPAPMPWFVLGFFATATIKSTGVLSQELVDALNLLTTLLLAAAMFGLGTAIRGRELWPLPARATVLGGFATVGAALVSLGAVVVLN